jgi:hypothetical protein
MVGIMSVKICGHRVQCDKTIKIYTLLGRGIAVVLLCLLFTLPVFAAEKKTNVPPQDIAPAAGATTAKPSVPALALILALGLRDVHGPIERAHMLPPQKPKPSRIALAPKK